jgi:hypothetical protein
MVRLRWLCGGLIGAVVGACAVGTGTSGDDDALDAASDVHNGGGDSSTTCNGQPTNLQTDNQNCGACGHACAMAATCTNGMCECPNGQIDCNGACSNVSSDLQNCGKCGNVCQTTGDAGLQGGGTWGCDAGTCTVDCMGSLTSCSDGCFDTTKDPDNCGMCGTACGMMSCCTSTCTDTTSDDDNCGTCGTKCTPTTQACSSGHCCATADTWCTSACINTQTNASNCGKCGSACTTGDTCMTGQCCIGTGTCVHALCNGTTSNPLKKGCDPDGCVTKVCAADSYCCLDIWDTICVSEVATYCSPYTCTGC